MVFWCCSWPTAGATPAAENERHAAWEALFLKKTSATLHGSAPGRPPAPPDHPKTTPRPPIEKVPIFIKNVDFSLEKCRFGAHRGILHYVLRRKRAMLIKNVNFELEICVKERGGRAPRCMGSVPVAEMLASEARRPRTSGHVSTRQYPSVARTETPLYAFSRAIDRESLAGLCNSLK